METLPIQSPFPGARCFLKAAVDSTMDEARRLAAAGYPRGTVIAADLQTSGRGRFRDRSWQSEPGRDLTFTTILPNAASALRGLPLRAGLALHRAVGVYARDTGLRIRDGLAIKWPNDLLAGGRKVAGMLVEASGDLRFLGVGINCGKPEDSGFRTRASGLAEELGAPVERFRLLELFLRELARALEDGAWRTEVAERLWLRGRRVRFRTGLSDPLSPGSRVLEGIVRSVGEEGELLLETESGLTPLASGEIQLPEQSPVWDRSFS